jgi:hypothetical protein
VLAGIFIHFCYGQSRFPLLPNSPKIRVVVVNPHIVRVGLAAVPATVNDSPGSPLPFAARLRHSLPESRNELFGVPFPESLNSPDLAAIQQAATTVSFFFDLFLFVAFLHLLGDASTERRF